MYKNFMQTKISSYVWILTNLKIKLTNRVFFLKNCVITVQKRCKDIQPDFCLTSDDSVFIFTDGQTNKQTWRIVNQIGPEAWFSEYVYFKYNMHSFFLNTVHKVIDCTLPTFTLQLLAWFYFPVQISRRRKKRKTTIIISISHLWHTRTYRDALMIRKHCTLAKVEKGGYVSELFFNHIFVSLWLNIK